MLISVLEPFVETRAIAGAVTLVANADEVLDVGTIGYADLENEQPMRADTLFWIASMTKPMTATALMMLVEAGSVCVDDPVEKYIPEFTGLWVVAERDEEHVLLRRPSRTVVVRDLLTHTSGLPFCAAAEEPTHDQIRLPIRTRIYTMAPLDFEPTTQKQYSNAGLNVIGRIIEVVSGQDYETFLAERLLQPLGMNETTFWPTKKQLERLAKSYRPDETATRLVPAPITQLTYPLDDRSRTAIPGGGLFSTADDVGRFCRMILQRGQWQGRQLLSAEIIDQMLAPQDQAYPGVEGVGGLGWQITGQTIGHGGMYGTKLDINRRTGLAMVYLIQHAGFLHNGLEAWSAFQAAAEKQFAPE